MRVALYARVSTRDKDQNPENQLLLLRRDSERAGDQVVAEYIDMESGGKADRKDFLRMMRDAQKRRFDVVKVFALDRFSSEGIEAVFAHLANLNQCNVRFWSHCEPMMNSIGPMTPLFTAIFSWAAAYRNERHSENVRLGQARVRAEAEAAGIEYQHGRKPMADDMVAEVRRLSGEGMSQRKIAVAVGVSVGAVNKYLKA